MKTHKRNTVRANAQGFTVLEILIVAGIIMIIASFTANRAMQTMSSYTLNSDAQQLATSLRVARMRAIALDKQVEFTFANGTYGISDPALRDTSTQRQPLPSLTLVSSPNPIPKIFFEKNGMANFVATDGASVTQLSFAFTNQRGQSIRITINRSGLTAVNSVASK